MSLKVLSFPVHLSLSLVLVAQEVCAPQRSITRVTVASLALFSALIAGIACEWHWQRGEENVHTTREKPCVAQPLQQVREGSLMPGSPVQQVSRLLLAVMLACNYSRTVSPSELPSVSGLTCGMLSQLQRLTNADGCRETASTRHALFLLSPAGYSGKEVCLV